MQLPRASYSILTTLIRMKFVVLINLIVCVCDLKTFRNLIDLRIKNLDVTFKLMWQL